MGGREFPVEDFVFLTWEVSSIELSQNVCFFFLIKFLDINVDSDLLIQYPVPNFFQTYQQLGAKSPLYNHLCQALNGLTKFDYTKIEDLVTSSKDYDYNITHEEICQLMLWFFFTKNKNEGALVWFIFFFFQKMTDVAI